MKKEDIIKVVRTCRTDPVFFIEEILGERLWEKQKEIVRAVHNHNSVAAASCHGIGKSFTAARIALHTLSLFPDSQVITTAPTDRQVRKVLWKEIRAAHKKSRIPLGGKVLTKQIQIDDEWFALGFATDNADSFQGMHAKKILVVVDEAAGVSEDIFNGIDGVLSGDDCKVLYIGNPTNTNGEFYKAYQNKNFVTFNISAFDTPNFTTYKVKLDNIIDGSWKEMVPKNNKMPYPTLVTPGWVADKVEKWGVESALFQAKVLGVFPEKEEFTTIPIYLWKTAQISHKEGIMKALSFEDIRIGVDVARFGNDTSCIAINIDGILFKKETVSSMDTTEVSEWVDKVIKYNFKGKVTSYKSIEINVDVIGVGAGVADNLKNNLGYSNVVDVKVSEKAKDSEKFTNRRAEMYWNVRDKIKEGSAKIAVHDEVLEDQITAIRYEFDSKGKIKLESKKKIKKRLGVSPDEADAVCLSFYEVEKKGKGFIDAWING